MFLYSITINIDDAVKLHWLDWVQIYFIPTLLKTNLVSDTKLLEMMEDEKNNETTTYSLQLFLNSEEDLNAYQQTFLGKHRHEMYLRYPNKYVEFRTLLKTIV